MATVTKPIALDRSLNTTESPSRNIADVLAEELSAMITAIGGLNFINFVVVAELPTTGISTTTIYLVPSDDPQSENTYDEYINLNGTVSGWEKIGSTDIDLSGYYTSAEVDGLLADKADVSDIPTVNDGTLTIQQNGETKGTFTANQSGNSTVNIEIPTTDIQTAVDEFSTFNGGLLSECIIELVPVQSGSGTPSPDNVRPISGHTEAELDVSDDDSTTVSYVTPLGTTIYMANIDMVSGKCDVIGGSVDLGTLSWNYSASAGHERFNSSGIASLAKLPATASDIGNIICENYQTVSNGDNFNHNGGASCALGQIGNGNLFIYDPNYTDVATFTSAMSGVLLVYELATPTPIQLSPTMVKALVGENHLSAPLDGQEITESKYKQAFTFDDVIAYIQSLS